ncbi:hypothetical protein EDD92_4184 [Streptomyces sp. TLI_185]|nr:hypothetical protein EDD92_4184 [Streptomyces sp. TLI_185]
MSRRSPISSPVCSCTYVRLRHGVPATCVLIPGMHRAIAFRMFEISSYVRNAGATLRVDMQGVNGANWNGYRTRWEIAFGLRRGNGETPAGGLWTCPSATCATAGRGDVGHSAMSGETDGRTADSAALDGGAMPRPASGGGGAAKAAGTGGTSGCTGAVWSSPSSCTARTRSTSPPPGLTRAAGGGGGVARFGASSRLEDDHPSCHWPPVRARRARGSRGNRCRSGSPL